MSSQPSSKAMILSLSSLCSARTTTGMSDFSRSLLMVMKPSTAPPLETSTAP